MRRAAIPAIAVLGCTLLAATADERAPAPAPAASPPVAASSGAPNLARLARFGVSVSTGAAPNYVPDSVCANCHGDLARSYAEVGMARSFARPRPEADIEDFARGSFVHGKSNQRFELSRSGPRLRFRREQLDAEGRPGAVFERDVDWVLGSGNHARVYLYREPGGELYQLPIAWYTQERRFGMAPGFDRADHDGVRRRVLRECMFCHNAYPDAPAGSDARGAPPVFPAELPEGTGCQRCHGPGAAHVAAAVGGEIAPARLAATIVNPGKLPAARRDDVCFQCHLQPSVAMPGVRRFGRGDWSFRPGESLAEYLVQVDAEEDGRSAGERFEINHHPYRLRQSRCAVAGKALSCLTCHDPHRKVPAAERAQHFRAACQSCHQPGARPGTLCRRPERPVAAGAAAHPDQGDCASCHMPKRRTQDVVHVVMTDHKIQRPPGRDLLAPLPEGQPDLVGVRLDDPARSPRRAEGELYRALAAAQAAPAAAAVAHAQRALAELRPRSPDPYLQLAEAQLQRRDYDGAAGTLATALELAPAHPLALEWRGLAAAASGRGEAALDDLRAAAAGPAARPEALYNLGRVLFALGRPAAALPELERAVAVRTNFAEAWLYLGRAQQALGREAEARASFARAAAVEPGLRGLPPDSSRPAPN